MGRHPPSASPVELEASASEGLRPFERSSGRSVYPPLRTRGRVVAVSLTLPLLHLDESVAVVSKPSGLLVHRGGWADDADVALTRLRDQLGRKVFPLHRLDRGTSGALVFALSSELASELGKAFEEGRVEKRYLALVRGIAPESVLVDHPIPRREDGPKVEARTSLRRLCSLDESLAGGRFSLVEARPHSGRLHQVRRHCKHLSHPILGDANYGKGELNRSFRDAHGLGRLALHAAALAFPHPATGTWLQVGCPMPEDFAGPLLRLGVPAVLLEPEEHLLLPPCSKG